MTTTDCYHCGPGAPGWTYEGADHGGHRSPCPVCEGDPLPWDASPPLQICRECGVGAPGRVWPELDGGPSPFWIPCRTCGEKTKATAAQISAPIHDALADAEAKAFARLLELPDIDPQAALTPTNVGVPSTPSERVRRPDPEPVKPIDALKALCSGCDLSLKNIAKKVLAGRDPRSLHRYMTGKCIPPHLGEWLQTARCLLYTSDAADDTR